jgi:hypothetical protein
MRRVIVIALCVLAFVITLPAPAHAWWYWLDELSGPGPFTGPQFDFRIACFGEDSGFKEALALSKHIEALSKQIAALSKCDYAVAPLKMQIVDEQKRLA